jgi:alpha-tubulin suppressor-like RCC1 family protein
LNGSGQLGDGTNKDRWSPVQVKGLTNVVAIDAGNGHTIALKKDGTVWTWGENSSGQLGDGTTTNRVCPVQVKGLTNVTVIAAGTAHNIVVKKDGTVWTWGENAHQQLGDGSNINRCEPLQVKELKNAAKAAAGSSHTAVTLTDGSVWVWGTYQTEPTEVENLGFYANEVANINATAVVVGEWHLAFLKKDGKVWALGSNGAGQLGQGTTFKYGEDEMPSGDIDWSMKYPVEVKDLSNAAAISAGNDYTVALKKDGTVWAWGGNWYGQMGNGYKNYRTTFQ